MYYLENFTFVLVIPIFYKYQLYTSYSYCNVVGCRQLPSISKLNDFLLLRVNKLDFAMFHLVNQLMTLYTVLYKWVM